MSEEPKPVRVQEVEDVVIRFAGDSGDGMQLTGTQFTNTAAIVGNDISTLPDFPAEIRAPAGTLAGVSGYQVHFASEDIFTPGDEPQVLIAMNPAALKASLSDLAPGGMIIVNIDEFTPTNLRKAGYETNPLKDGSLRDYEVYEVPITTLNRNALEGIEGLSTKEIDRSRNFFALGLTFWLFDRPLDNTLAWIRERFKDKPKIAEANSRALQAGYNFGETTELFQTRYRVRPKRACSRSACSGFVGRPVLGPPRCTLTMTTGSSSITARLMASLFSATPGPLVPVAAKAPPKAAPMAAPMAAISSSAWKVRTSKCFWAARKCRMSLAGVMG